MKRGSTFVLITILSLISSCAATYNTNFPLIEKGMTKQEVTTLIGPAISAASGPQDAKVLFFKLASSILDTDGSDTREYFVVFQEDRVIGYGERQDAITMQRAIVQFNSAWNAAKAASF